MTRSHLTVIALLALLISGCISGASESEPEYTQSGLLPENFHRVIDGDTTALYTLTNSDGMEVCITNYGAHIVSIMVPGRDDVMRDVVLGMDSIGAYQNSGGGEIGAVMGRYGGLMRHRPSAKSNEWMHRVYKVAKATGNELTLNLIADSASDGMPGNAAVQLDYRLTDENTLELIITAISDAVTPIDIAQRLYFNLDGTTGEKMTDIGSHLLTMKTDQYLVRDSLRDYPGDMLMTIWTPFGFQKERKLSRTLNADFHQVKRMDGIDGYFVMSGYGEELAEMLTLYSPESGIELTVSTSFPGTDIYTANRFDGTLHGKNNMSYGRRCAIAITPHYYPYANDMPGWGMDATLSPGQVMSEKVTYRFSIRNE